MGKQSTRWFRYGPLDIEILRSGVLLSNHESRHLVDGLDELDPFRIPIMFARMDRFAHTYHDGTYFVCHTYRAQLATSSLLLANKRYGAYGTFQAYAKLSGAVKFNTLYLFGLEAQHGHPTAGLITFYYSGFDEKYYALSVTAGGQEQTDLGALDWTGEQLFSIEWSAGQILFSIAGGLVATHNIRVPAVGLSWFLEALTQDASIPASEGIVYQRAWEEV